jgi:aryl-alcohol dehydrogenase-like predicted oxidoreductase
VLRSAAAADEKQNSRVQTRTTGPVTVSIIGPGGMPMSIEGRPGEARSVRTIHAALDAGGTLVDTTDAYHLNAGETGHNG